MSRASQRRPALIAAALCVLAAAAVLITAPTVFGAWRPDKADSRSGPGLATLSNQRLAELLPKRGEFPSSWNVDQTTELRDVFGYFRYHVSDDGLGFTPVECFGVVGVASTGAFDVAEVFAHDPADPGGPSDRKDVRLMVGREFDPSGFDAMIGLVSRCSRFGTAGAGSYAVNIIEDSRPSDGPQRFRYSLTSTLSAEPADLTQTEYFSYARRFGLILTGSASTGHQQAFDALFEHTLNRISTS